MVGATARVGCAVPVRGHAPGAFEAPARMRSPDLPGRRAPGESSVLLTIIPDTRGSTEHSRLQAPVVLSIGPGIVSLRITSAGASPLPRPRSIDREKLRQALEIPERYDILPIPALGKPAETVALVDAGPAGAPRAEAHAG